MQEKSIKGILKSLYNTDKQMFTLGVIGIFATSFIVLFFGYAVKILINGISINSNAMVSKSMILLISSSILLCFFAFLRSFCLNCVAEKYTNGKKIQIYNRILNSNGSSVAGNPESFITILTGELNLLKSKLSTSFSFFVRSSATAIGGLFMSIYSSAYLSFVLIGTVLVVIFPIFIFKKKIKANKAELLSKTQELNSSFFDSIVNIKSVKSLSAEDFEMHSKKEDIASIYKIEKKRLFVRSITIAIGILGGVSGILFATYIGAEMIAKNVITSGDLASFMLYSVIFAIGLSGAGEYGADFFQSKRILAKINDVCCKIKQDYTGSELSAEEVREIKCSGIVHNYDENASIEIDGFAIKKGELAILSSHSGTGKTTLFEILSKYIEIPKKLITIDDVDLNEIDGKSVRSRISYLFQNSLLLKKTIFENLCQNGKCNSDIVIDILNTINLGHLTSRMNDKISSIELSGGERRRLLLAMCLMREADIVILDEPSVQLDSENIEIVANLILKYCENKITFIASHDSRFIEMIKNKRNAIDIKTKRIN